MNLQPYFLEKFKEARLDQPKVEGNRENRLKSVATSAILFVCTFDRRQFKQHAWENFPRAGLAEGEGYALAYTFEVSSIAELDQVKHGT